MAETLKYGNELLAQFPDNQSQLIKPQDVRDLVVSQRTGGAIVTNTTEFVVPMTDGVPVAINPLLPNPNPAGVLWAIDANNRAFPNYGAAIPSLVIPAGYAKFIEARFIVGVHKVGQGTDPYLFQVDNAGVPVGSGVLRSFTADPNSFNITAQFVAALDSNPLVGLTVTPQGTSDDLTFTQFSMDITDFQQWQA